MLAYLNVACDTCDDLQARSTWGAEITHCKCECFDLVSSQQVISCESISAESGATQGKISIFLGSYYITYIITANVACEKLCENMFMCLLYVWVSASHLCYCDWQSGLLNFVRWLHINKKKFHKLVLHCSSFIELKFAGPITGQVSGSVNYILPMIRIRDFRRYVIILVVIIMVSSYAGGKIWQPPVLLNQLLKKEKKQALLLLFYTYPTLAVTSRISSAFSLRPCFKLFKKDTVQIEAILIAILIRVCEGARVNYRVA